MNNVGKIDRRRFVEGAATLPLAVSLPVVAQSGTPNHAAMHPHWHRDWKQAIHDFDMAPESPKGASGSTLAEDDAYRRSWDAAEKICNTPADTLEGVEAQLAHFIENFGEYSLNNIGDNLDGRLIQSALDSVRRINERMKA